MGRPRKDRLEALRASVAAGGPFPAPSETWCTDLDEPCDRFRVTQELGCGDCDRTWWRPVACTREDCPRCAKRVSSRRGGRAATRMGGLGIAEFTLTFPGRWWRYLRGEALLEVTRLVTRHLQAWAIAELKGQVGGIVRWHATGDTCPRCKQEGKALALFGRCDRCNCEAPWKPHINFVVAGAVIAEDGTVEKRHLYLGKNQLAALHGAMDEALLELAMVLPALGKRGFPKANLYWQYRATPEAIRHASRYMLRPFPAFAGQLPRQRDFGALAGGHELARAFRRAVAGDGTGDDEPAVCPCCGMALAVLVLGRREGDRARVVLERWVAREPAELELELNAPRGPPAVPGPS